MSQILINNIKTKKRRAELRDSQTKCEILVWSRIKNKHLGYKFRRQFGIGPFIVDFYCTQLRLIIEIDGGVHFEKEAQVKDIKREQFLLANNFYIKRFHNMQVENDLDEVIERIKLTIFELSTPSNSPLSKGENR